MPARVGGTLADGPVAPVLAFDEVGDEGAEEGDPVVPQGGKAVVEVKPDHHGEQVGVLRQAQEAAGVVAGCGAGVVLPA